MQQTACHLDSRVKSNDIFTSRGQELKDCTSAFYGDSLSHLNTPTEGSFQTYTWRVVPSINMSCIYGFGRL
jgi:hypothetical protein